MQDPRIAYREAAARGASQVQLVIRLYEQIIEDLRQATSAIEQNNIEVRTGQINHAILVVGHLQSRLDFQTGGKPARDLDHFYNALRYNLMEAQMLASKEMLVQQITDLLTVRDAWLEVERTEHPAATGRVEAAAATAATSDSAPARANWKG